MKGDGTTRGPHVPQQKFHADKSDVRIISGGNRSGKSTAGINEDVAHALGYRPWLKADHPDYKVTIRIPNKGLVCGESFGEQVKKVLIPKLLGDPEKNVPGAIPTHEVASVRRNPAGVIVEIVLKNGSTIHLQSYEQPVDLFESADYDWFHADEPPPRSIWIAVRRGLTDRRGRAWITMTPLKEPWIYDDLYTRSDVALFYFDIEDNCGFGLTREGIDQFARDLTDDEKEARLRGKYFHLSGLVYKTYSRLHRIKRVPIPASWPIWFHVDTHPRTPHHAVYIAISPHGIKYVCGEYKNKDATNRVQPFVDALRTYEKTVLKRSMEDGYVRLIEPGSQTPDPLTDGKSIWDAFNDLGMSCKPGSKNRDSGILLMQNELRFDKELGISPTILFFDDLEGVHYEMTHYIWDDWQKKQQDLKTAKQEPRKQNDHFIEGMHRILLEEPQYFGNEEEDEPVRQARPSSVTGY